MSKYLGGFGTFTSLDGLTYTGQMNPKRDKFIKGCLYWMLFDTVNDGQVTIEADDIANTPLKRYVNQPLGDNFFDTSRFYPVIFDGVNAVIQKDNSSPDVISFSSNNSLYLKNTGNIFTEVGKFLLTGTDKTGLVKKVFVNFFKGVAGSDISMRLVNKFGSIIADVNFVSSQSDNNIVELNLINPFPLEPQSIRIDIKGDAGGTKSNLGSIIIIYSDEV